MEIGCKRRANPVGAAWKASPALGTRAGIEFMMEDQKLVMEATTRIELVYTVLQTVA